MNDINDMLKKAFARYGAKSTLDFAEGFGLISKTHAKQMKTRKRGCTNGNDTMFCFICTTLNGKNIYGARKCKTYRKQNNMKVSLFFTEEDIISKVIEKAMR